MTDPHEIPEKCAPQDGVSLVRVVVGVPGKLEKIQLEAGSTVRAALAVAGFRKSPSDGRYQLRLSPMEGPRSDGFHPATLDDAICVDSILAGC